MKYEYRHECIQALVDREGSDRRWTYKVYNEQMVQEVLNSLGEDGWELVSMEPKWLYRGYNEITIPDIVECWYATFKRPLEQ